MECPNQTAPNEFILSGFPCTEELKVPLILFFSIMFALTISGNSMIILVVILDHQLHKPMYWFLCHLSILDMAFSAVGYDCFLAICKPLHYSNIISWKTCLTLSLGTITGGSLNSTFQTSITFHAPYGEDNYIDYVFCDIPSILKLACVDIKFNELMFIIDMNFITMACFLLILASYAYIITAILKITSSEDQHRAFSTCSAQLTVVCIYFLPVFYRYMRPASQDSMDSVVSMFYTTITPLLNPLIYMLRNKEMKTALLKLWRWNP